MSEHELAHLLLEALDLLVLQGLFVLGLRAKGVLGGQEELLLPVLDLGHGEAVLAGRLLHRGLTLEDADDKRRPSLGRPTLDVLGESLRSR